VLNLQICVSGAHGTWHMAHGIDTFPGVTGRDVNFACQKFERYEETHCKR